MMAYKEKMKLQGCSEGYNRDKTHEVIVWKIEGNGTTPYLHDNSYDYHVSLDGEADANSFHTHQQQGIPSEVTGVPVIDHEAYSGEVDRNVYSVCFPQPEISVPDFGGSSLQQTYVGSGDQCFYQTQPIEVLVMSVSRCIVQGLGLRVFFLKQGSLTFSVMDIR